MTNPAREDATTGSAGSVCRGLIAIHLPITRGNVKVGRAMQFASEMHLRVPRRCFSGPEERREGGVARAIAEIGSSADLLDKRDARSDARTYPCESIHQGGRAAERIRDRFSIPRRSQVPQVEQDSKPKSGKNISRRAAFAC